MKTILVSILLDQGSIHLKKKEYDSIKTKARNFVIGLKWGRGATDKMIRIILKVLGKPCYWCGKKLTIDNIQLDHKIPLKRPSIYSPITLRRLNSPKNLRIICWRCNQIKGTIDEKDFQKLMDLLKMDKKLKYIVQDALYYSYLYKVEGYRLERFYKREGIY